MLLTIGHSTRPIEEFLRMLAAHGVELLIDVRTAPRSRRHPQFNRESLPESLRAAGIEYRHMPALGGLRRPRPDSMNTAWRNESFRGYADYMQTPAFETAQAELLELARGRAVAIMCAEAVPWRCHRSLIADAALARGVVAEHIMTVTSRKAHVLTSFARLDGARVTYPSA